MNYNEFLCDLEIEKYHNHEISDDEIINLAEEKMLEELIKEVKHYDIKGIKKVTNLYEAFYLVDKQLPDEHRLPFFTSYIVAHMNLIKVLQSYYITWQILLDEEPSIVFDDEGNVESLITDTEYNPLEVIELLRETISTIKNKYQK